MLLYPPHTRYFACFLSVSTSPGPMFSGVSSDHLGLHHRRHCRLNTFLVFVGVLVSVGSDPLCDSLPPTCAFPWYTSLRRTLVAYYGTGVSSNDGCRMLAHRDSTATLILLQSSQAGVSGRDARTDVAVQPNRRHDALCFVQNLGC